MESLDSLTRIILILATNKRCLPSPNLQALLFIPIVQNDEIWYNIIGLYIYILILYSVPR